MLSSPFHVDNPSGSTTPCRVTVIIPTLCEAARSAEIRRAIASIRNASREQISILVVVNGDRYHPRLLEEIRSDPGVSILQLPVASVTAAQLAGRRAIETEFFSYLDDDDEYLPGSLDHRLELMNEGETYDVAVTEGYRQSSGVDSPLYRDLSKVRSDPLMAILKVGWLHSSNALFRTSTIPESYFCNLEVHGEWTWLAFRLAMDRKRIVTSNRPTSRYHDTPQSLSKSIDHSRGYIRLFERMIREKPSEPYLSMLRARLGRAHHDYSELLLRERKIGLAFRHHLRSLSYPEGWKFLPYTRFLIYEFMKSAII